MYLVDTNILSAAAPTKVAVPAELVSWMDMNSDRLFLSVVTIAEIVDGIAKVERQGARRKARALNLWLDTLLHLYSGRVIPFDVEIAIALGALSDKARSLGLDPGFADLTIAATAQRRRLVLLTRNLRHFVGLEIVTHDPYSSLPSPQAP